MLTAHFFARILSVTMMLLGVGVASGQNYPTRPIRIVASGVGGGTDFAARLIAQGLTGSLGQQVIVDNRPSGVIPGEIVSKASPDGHTLLLATGILWLLPFLQNKVPYDPVNDFSPVTLAVSSPNILAVTPSLPVKSVKELIDFAKARPGTLNYAMTAHGGGAHLAAELFQVMAGINMVRVPYKSGGTAVTELMSGQVQLYFVSAGSVVPHIKSGRLRALAVTSATPSAVMPELPTVAAFLPGYELVTVYGIFAPAKTPAVIINRLHQEIVHVVNKAEVREKFLNSGVEPVGSSPEALGTMRKSEMARMGKVIRDAGIRAD